MLFTVTIAAVAWLAASACVIGVCRGAASGDGGTRTEIGTAEDSLTPQRKDRIRPS